MVNRTIIGTNTDSKVLLSLSISAIDKSFLMVMRIAGVMKKPLNNHGI